MLLLLLWQFDIFNACKNLWGGELIEKVKARKGVLVVRPDSGDPPVCCHRRHRCCHTTHQNCVSGRGQPTLSPGSASGGMTRNWSPQTDFIIDCMGRAQ